MFFVLSKTLNYLVMPLSIIVICFLLAVFLKHRRWKRSFFWIGFGLLLFFSNHFIANEVMHAWEIPAVAIKEVRAYKLGIVLTGATLPHREPDDRVYFQRGADRVVHTVQLFKAGRIQQILISGGTSRLLESNVRPEAEKFKDAMMLMGVPSDAIIIESATRNTGESSVVVKTLLDSLGYQGNECLLITSAFHMRRSLASYRKVGLRPSPFSTDFYSHPRSYYFDVLIIPKIEAVVIWHKLTKEWVGMLAYKIVGYS